MMPALARSSGAVVAAAVLAVASAVPCDLRAGEAEISLAPAPGPPRDSAMPPVTIRVAIASAREEEGEIDPKADDIFQHLPARFHSIRLVEERTIQIYLGDHEQILLPSGQTVNLLPVAIHEGQLHMQIAIPDVLSTSMRMSNHRAFYVGGVDSGDGTLIFKLVPEFTAYTTPPSAKPAAPPQAVPAGGNR